MIRLRRRLEDTPYENDDLAEQTPPWYTHLLLVILLTMVAGVLVYGIYRFIQKRIEKQAFNQLTTGAKDITQELQPDDDDQVRQQELTNRQWTSTNNEMGAARQGNHNEYVSMMEDSPNGGVTV